MFSLTHIADEQHSFMCSTHNQTGKQ